MPGGSWPTWPRLSVTAALLWWTGGCGWWAARLGSVNYKQKLESIISSQDKRWSSCHNLPEQVSVLGPGAHKWRESVAEEPHDYELTNLGMMPGDIICHMSYVMSKVSRVNLWIKAGVFSSAATPAGDLWEPVVGGGSEPEQAAPSVQRGRSARPVLARSGHRGRGLPARPGRLPGSVVTN